MSPKWSHSENMNAVLPCKVAPNRAVRYFVQHDFKGKKKNECGNGQNKPFLHPVLPHCTIGLVTSTQQRALLFLLPSLVGNIRLNWMFCLASSHSHTTKYDLHSHFTDETTAHGENRHRRRRFWRFPQTGESSRWLCSPHCKSSLLPHQPRLFVSPCLYTQKSHELWWSHVWIPGAQVNLFTPAWQWHETIVWLRAAYREDNVSA